MVTPTNNSNVVSDTEQENASYANNQNAPRYQVGQQVTGHIFSDPRRLYQAGDGVQRYQGAQPGDVVRLGENYFVVGNGGTLSNTRANPRGFVTATNTAIRPHDPRDFISPGYQGPRTPNQSPTGINTAGTGTTGIKYSQPNSLTGGGITTPTGITNNFVDASVSTPVQSSPNTLNTQNAVQQKPYYAINLFDSQNREAIKQGINSGIYSNAGDILKGKTNPVFTPLYGYSTPNGTIPIGMKVTPIEVNTGEQDKAKDIAAIKFFYPNIESGTQLGAGGSEKLYNKIPSWLQSNSQRKPFYEIPEIKIPDIINKVSPAKYTALQVGEQFLLGVSDIPNQFRKNPLPSFADTTKNTLVGVSVGGIAGTGTGIATRAAASNFGNVIAGRIETGATIAGAGLLGSEAIMHPRQVGQNIIPILVGGVAFGKGYETEAGSNIRYGNLKNIKFEGNIEGRNVGTVSRAEVSTKIREFGNTREENVPVTLVMQGKPGNQAGNIKINAQAFTDEFVFKGQSTRSVVDYSGVYNPAKKLQVLYNIDLNKATLTKAGKGVTIADEGMASRSIVPSRSVTIELQPEGFQNFMVTRRIGGKSVRAYDVGYLEPRRTINVQQDVVSARFTRRTALPVNEDVSSFSVIDQAHFQKNPIIDQTSMRSYLNDKNRPEIFDMVRTPRGVSPDALRRFNIEGATLTQQNQIPEGMRIGISRDRTVNQGLKLLKDEGLLATESFSMGGDFGKRGQLALRTQEFSDTEIDIDKISKKKSGPDNGYINPEGLFFANDITFGTPKVFSPFVKTQTDQRNSQNYQQRNNIRLPSLTRIDLTGRSADTTPRSTQNFISDTTQVTTPRFKIGLDTIRLPTTTETPPRIVPPRITIPPNVPPITPPPPPPSLRLPSFNRGTNQTRSIRRNSRSFKYVPSLTAGYYHITGPKPRGFITEASVRPISVVKRNSQKTMLTKFRRMH